MERAQEVSASSDPFGAQEFRSLRVLLADDVDIILAGSKAILTSLGHRVVRTASDGMELL
eukprot:CAMPEP_0174734304 /NCGR_PEP_ID=MMETSP1094-20130205/63051_1 /TAXON_ID=156173 /ORGANISM="Chrysochromulina brevifilum, Strain UTEX LB 985" /LENGTH=59 /DNA_ID=CAMNT_0015937103 /DNA_START=95 /DNA_END=270 /DNA_ORIENTATION=+